MKTMQWIKTDKEMPRIGEHVVVRIKKHSPESRAADIDVQMCYNDGKGGPAWQKGWCKGDRFEITHWMRVELPEDKS